MDKTPEEKAKDKITDVLLTNKFDGTTITRIVDQLEKAIKETKKGFEKELEGCKIANSLMQEQYEEDKKQIKQLKEDIKSYKQSCKDLSMANENWGNFYKNKYGNEKAKKIFEDIEKECGKPHKVCFKGGKPFQINPKLPDWLKKIKQKHIA